MLRFIDDGAGASKRGLRDVLCFLVDLRIFFNRCLLDGIGKGFSTSTPL